jgi:hypothetical protein
VQQRRPNTRPNTPPLWVLVKSCQLLTGARYSFRAEVG